MTKTIIMVAVIRVATVLINAVAVVSVISIGASGQVPAGVPYDPAKHPNPVVTWVNKQDFKIVTFAEAEKSVGIEIMSLSQDEGRRESIEVASPSQSRPRVRIVNEEVEVMFYPVIRQTYELKSGSTFVMCSFRFPRAAVPAEALNMAAFGRPRRPSEARFGLVPVPDRLDIRGFPGLIFDDGKQRTVYWFEFGAGHTVTSDVPREELFRVLKDLL